MALRAGSVGPGSEVGLGSSRDWGSGRPVRPVVPPLVRKPRRASRPSLSRSGAPRSSLRPPRGGRGSAVGGVVRAASGAERLYAPGPVGRGTGGRRAAEQRPRLWACAGPFSRISPATVPRRDLPSVPPGRPWRCPAGGRGRGGAIPARRLGRRLTAGLELVRTRGIRLFN